MRSFCINVRSNQLLTIIPDETGNPDMHPVFVYRYRIYRVCENDSGLINKNYRNHAESKNSGDYMGTIAYEIPGRLLNYIADGKDRLSPFEIKDVVDRIDDHRDTPANWKTTRMDTLSYYIEECNDIQREIKKLLSAYNSHIDARVEQLAIINAVALLRSEYNVIQKEMMD